MLKQSTFSKFDKVKFKKNLNVFGAYFSFLFKVVTRNFANWMIFIAYILILSLILLIIPAILNSSPADYWNNPLVQVSSFVMPLVAVLASSISLDLFRDGIDTGIELIIISKPISRVNYVLAKFSLLLIVLFTYSIVASLLGLLTYTIPKMDPSLVGDLIGGLFTGSFVIGLFFASLSILISLKYGKNATNMIVILIAILFNFLTPLSSLFFDTPSKVLSNQGINLIQQTIRTKNNSNKNIVFQITSSFGETQFYDVDEKYKEADQETFYSKSFYLNFGNMIGSLYNLGSLAPYHNGNISISPNNTTWNFIEPINQSVLNQVPYISIGTPSITINNTNNENLITSSLSNEQIVFLPQPASTSFLSSILSRSNPKYTYLSNLVSNATTSVIPTQSDYEKDNQKLQTTLKNVNTSTNNLLDNNTSVVNNVVNEINGITSATDISGLSKAFQMLNALLTKENMTTFKEDFEKNYNSEPGMNNEQIAKNVFVNKVNLFYGLDNLRNAVNEDILYQEFIKEVISNNKFSAINNTTLTEDSVWTILDQSFTSLFKWYPELKKQLENSNEENDTTSIRNKIIGTTLQIFFTNQYSATYLIDLISTNATTDNIYKTSLGLVPIREEQLKLSYVVETEPIVDPSIIVALMVIISFGLFVGIGFIYYHEDIK